LKGTNSKH